MYILFSLTIFVSSSNRSEVYRLRFFILPQLPIYPKRNILYQAYDNHLSLYFTYPVRLSSPNRL